MPRPSWLRILLGVCVLGAFGLGAALWVTRPEPLAANKLPADHVDDVENGRELFLVGGCLSCHGPDPAQNPQADTALPSGGKPLPTPVGTFFPPNLTPDPETGIGDWSPETFANAMLRGVSANSEHLFPAFPYTSYQHMTVEDVLDLRAYLMSLPAVRQAPRGDSVPLSAIARPFIGLWNLLALDGKNFEPDPTRPASWNRGAYLVEAPGHCGECHTPRDIFLVPERSRYLEGGPHPSEAGKVPSLRGLVGGRAYATSEDLYDAFKYGEMFGYDGLSSGGMGQVQANLATIDDSDLRAIVDYLASLK